MEEGILMINREQILEKLELGLKPVEEIYAMWLEGSDGTGNADEFSDLDIVLDVQDGYESEAFNQIEEILSSIGTLDLLYEKEHYHPKLQDKVYHLKGTPDTLFLDVTIQSHSRTFTFTKENTSEIPHAIFDKMGVIQFANMNQEEFVKGLNERLYHLENTIKQKARAEKYIKRGKTIEAMGYYQKYVLSPLIELLRIKYIPVNHDYFIVSFSKHLPNEVVKEMEDLFLVDSLEELGDKVDKAYHWFNTLLPEVKADLKAKFVAEEETK